MANNPYQFTQTGAEIQALLNKVQSPDSSPTANSTNLVTSGGVKAALDQKAAKSDVDTIEGKIPSSASSSNKLVPQSDISAFITKTVNDLANYYLKSETYTKAEVQALIGAINQFHYEVYASTSEVTDPQSNVLYLIGPTGSGSDKYEEYVYTTTFVKIGDTSIDLSGYVTTEALNTALENYTTTSQLTELLNAKADKDTDAVPGNLAEFDANGNPVDSGDKKGDYVKKGSWDSSLTSGLAENLIDTKGQGSEQSFTRRTSCGEESISDDGSALFKKLLGNSLVWNQLVTNGYVTKTGDIANYGQLIYTVQTQIVGHKYYLACDVNTTSPRFVLSLEGSVDKSCTGVGSLKRYSGIVTAIGASPNYRRNFRIVNTSSDKHSFITKNAVSIDLTLMFGAGNEPATVEEFEALFNKPYYAYNAGQIINNNVEAYETVGFNQWDEEWELGRISLTDGTNTSGTGFRSKNYIPVFSGVLYYGKMGDTSRALNALFYDANKNFITGVNGSDNYLNIKNVTFTIPANCAYIRFYSPGAISGYENNICINLSWSGYRNGEYEPYWKRSLPLGLNSFRVTDGTDIITVNGLKSAGSVYDEIDLVRKKYIKRVNTRGYESGDESDSSVITDMINTNYALATPIEYDLVDEIQAISKVADFGVEIAVPYDEVDASGVPKTAPLRAVVKYSDDFTRGWVTRNRILQSQESMDNILTALGAALGFSWAKSWDAANDQYTYTVTMNSQSE